MISSRHSSPGCAFLAVRRSVGPSVRFSSFKAHVRDAKNACRPFVTSSSGRLDRDRSEEPKQPPPPPPQQQQQPSPSQKPPTSSSSLARLLYSGRGNVGSQLRKHFESEYQLFGTGFPWAHHSPRPRCYLQPFLRPNTGYADVALGSILFAKLKQRLSTAMAVPAMVTLLQSAPSQGTAVTADTIQHDVVFGATQSLLTFCSMLDSWQSAASLSADGTSSQSMSDQDDDDDDEEKRTGVHASDNDMLTVDLTVTDPILSSVFPSAARLPHAIQIAPNALLNTELCQKYMDAVESIVSQGKRIRIRPLAITSTPQLHDLRMHLELKPRREMSWMGESYHTFFMHHDVILLPNAPQDAVRFAADVAIPMEFEFSLLDKSGSGGEVGVEKSERQARQCVVTLLSSRLRFKDGEANEEDVAGLDWKVSDVDYMLATEAIYKKAMVHWNAERMSKMEGQE